MNLASEKRQDCDKLEDAVGRVSFRRNPCLKITTKEVRLYFVTKQNKGQSATHFSFPTSLTTGLHGGVTFAFCLRDMTNQLVAFSSRDLTVPLIPLVGGAMHNGFLWFANNSNSTLGVFFWFGTQR